MKNKSVHFTLLFTPSCYLHINKKKELPSGNAYAKSND